jgi:hypothetical protein
MGAGGGVELSATRTQLAREPSYTFKGNALEGAHELAAQYEKNLPYLRAARMAAGPGPL